MLATVGPSAMESRGRNSPFGSPDANRRTSFLIRDILGKSNHQDEENTAPHDSSSSPEPESGSPHTWNDDFEKSQTSAENTRWKSEFTNYKCKGRTSAILKSADRKDLRDDTRCFPADQTKRKRSRTPPACEISVDRRGIRFSREELRKAEWEEQEASEFDQRSTTGQQQTDPATRESPSDVYNGEKGASHPAYEKFRHSLLKHIDEDAANHPMYRGILLNPANYPMIDLRYAYAVAARQLQVPQIPHLLMGYPNAAFVNPTAEAAYASYLERARHLVATREATTERSHNYSQHQRYTLNDRWAKEKEISSFSCHLNPSMNEDCFSDSDPNNSERGSDHPPSPSSSTTSMTSPSSPQKNTVHLPAYLRSRLSGSANTEIEGSNGKPKKCRRSRTVFTELQMLGLEKRFEKQQYLSTPDRVELAELLGLSQLQVKTWYQNRRMKWKKQVLQGGGTEPPTKPKGRPRKIRPEEQSATKPTASSFTKNEATHQDLKHTVAC